MGSVEAGSTGKAGLPRRVAVVGLGLMGASLARSLRAADAAIGIAAVEPDAAIRDRALRDGVADEAAAAPGEALGTCDLAVLCAPVAAIEELLAPVSRLLPGGAILTDIGGAKERVVARAAREVRSGVAFVGAHPMFGGQGGYGSSRADRWRGGTVAVCLDGAPEAAVARVEALHRALGARVLRCRAAEHDAAVATVSHLPYLVAAALSLLARDSGPLARELAGPGLKDMTRLAAFAFDVQGEVARRNAFLPGEARRLEGHLGRLLQAVADSPAAARAALEEARTARLELYPPPPSPGPEGA